MKLLLYLAVCCGLYAQQTVSVSSGGTTVSATITPVAPPTNLTVATQSAIITAVVSSVPTTITLPIEITNATPVVNVSFVIAPGAATAGARLSLTVHNLNYDTQASVMINNSVWMPLSAANVTLDPLALAYGGIGGGFNTLNMTLAVPPGVLTVGLNSISFRFNGTDGVRSAYRVLGLNLMTATGAPMLPSSTFAWDDPTKWVAPVGGDPVAGHALWQGATLTDPATGAAIPIKAHCADCHTADARDLKYFNYSNGTIIARSTFHGLTPAQGANIAAYVRSLATPAPGRPWNPPYQPGVGQETVPVANWAAGAGLSAVLPSDSAMQMYLPASVFPATAYLNPRETPVAFQLPDWNRWLPIIHPMDGFPTQWPGSAYSTAFPTLSAGLTASKNIAATYRTMPLGAFGPWNAALIAFGKAVGIGTTTSTMVWTPALRQSYYSLGLFNLVKFWELNQDYGLESLTAAIYPHPNSRGWYGVMPFAAAPNIQHVPPGPGLGNGTQIFSDYTSSVWYILQLIVNDGQGTQTDHEPLDYPYVGGFLANVAVKDAHIPGAMINLEFITKALQEYTLTGTPPTVSSGWHAIATCPADLTLFNDWPEWQGYDTATIARYLTLYTQAWYNQAITYTPMQYAQGGWTHTGEDPAMDSYSSTLGGLLWYGLPRLKWAGVPAGLISQMTTFAASLFPMGNWALNAAATCTGINGNQNACTSGATNVF